MQEFRRMSRLPPYVFASVNEIKMQARRKGEDIIDLGMGNPDIPTPKHIVNKLVDEPASDEQAQEDDKFEVSGHSVRPRHGSEPDAVRADR